MTTERYIWCIVVGVLIGLFSYQGCTRISDKKKASQDITFLTDALKRAQMLKCDTVFDTTWKTGPVVKRFVTVNDTIYLALSGPCPENNYQDTLRFEGADFAYKIKTNGTLEELEPYLKIYAPRIIKVPIPCPELSNSLQPVTSKWSAYAMLGYPACAQLGVQFDITPSYGAIGGVFLSSKSANAMVGLRIRLP